MPGTKVVTRTCIRFLCKLQNLLEQHATTHSVYFSSAAKEAAVWCTSIVEVEMSPIWEKKRWGAKLSTTHLAFYEGIFPYEEFACLLS